MIELPRVWTNRDVLDLPLDVLELLYVWLRPVCWRRLTVVQPHEQRWVPAARLLLRVGGGHRLHLHSAFGRSALLSFVPFYCEDQVARADHTDQGEAAADAFLLFTLRHFH